LHNEAWFMANQRYREAGRFVALALALALALASGCDGGDSGGECAAGDPSCDPCAGGRCDLPDDPDEVLCTHRRADAFDTQRPAYLDAFLRWSCLDVDGVTEEDRGQEYCEAFAIVELPGEDAAAPAGEPLILGRNLGPDASYGTTPVGLDLDAATIAALEIDESAVVGQCVFSSWNSDIDMPVAGCEAGPAAAECPRVMGVPVTAELFRMQFDKNSDEAAEVLVEDCLLTEAAPGDPHDLTDLNHDDFMRGCLLNAELNDTAFSKADSTICPAAMRLGECGCYPRGYDGSVDFPELLSPSDRRGFALGSWSGFVHGSEPESALPPGCRYVDLGDGSQTLVSCDLTAADVLNHAFDLRGRCDEKYADRIVVHVAVPEAHIECYPAEASGPNADRCGARPWVVQP
jgi:hypothetical protein